MKKETILGFSILLLGFWFFNSKFYYQMLGQPYPYDIQAQTEMLTVTEVGETETVKPIEQQSEEIYETKLEAEEDSIAKAEIIPAKEIILSNEVLQLKITEDGAKIVSAKALKYTYGKGLTREGEIVELISDTTIGILTTQIGSSDLINERFVYDIENSNAKTAIFNYYLNGEKITKTFEIKENSYFIDFKIQSNLIAKEQNIIMFDGGISESETDNNKSLAYSERVVMIAHDKNKTERVSMKKTETYNLTGQFHWVALNSKYFSFVTILQDNKNRDLQVSSFLIDETAKVEPMNLNYQIALTQRVQRNSQNDDFVNYSIFLGPSKHSELAQAKVGLERTLFRGYAWFFGANLWFPPLCEAVLWFLNFFGKLIGDYGVSIILLTLLLRIVTYPLSQASINSMASMQALQPKILDIQKKYAENKQLQQQKILELYQSEGINPLASLGGCIPILVQMPIMIALFIVLRKAVELRGETAFFLPWVHDLSQAEVLFKLPFVIPFYGDNFAILPILMAGLMFFQNKMTIKDPNQIAMVYMMPIIMLVMFNNFPAGLTLYFAFSNLLQIIQQKFFTKKPVILATNISDTKKGKKKK